MKPLLYRSDNPGVRAAWVLLVAAMVLGPAMGVDAQPLPAGERMAQADPAEETPEQREARLEKVREERRAQAEAERNAKNAQAIAQYDEMVKAYLTNDMAKVQELSKGLKLQSRVLTREQQAVFRHMSEQAPEYRPSWWNGTKKQEKNSFKAGIWGREFWANYVPTKELGLQAVFPEYDQRTGEITDLIVLVTWKPLMVDSTEPAKGRLSVDNGYTLGDIAEIIIWHELGHNYITEQVPTKANIDLYENYGELYSTMHEFFADMTALYHCTPRARKIVLQFRLDGLDYYTQDQSHCRASHGIGAIILTDMFMNPEAWPSVRFPPKVPDKQPEINTIIYVYENLPKELTIEEEIRLQQLAKEFIMENGEDTFKRKGELKLANGLKMKLMFTDDVEHQKQRDNWVSGKLENLIKDGRADKLAEGETYNPPDRNKNRRPQFTIRRLDNDGNPIEDESEPRRIEVPWEQ